MRRVGKVFGVSAFVVLAAFATACGGKSAGDSCTKDGECGSNLTCQPVQGRSENYCCATPASATKDAPNCSPVAIPGTSGNDAGGSDAGAG
jgi:hypothetical protein